MVPSGKHGQGEQVVKKAGKTHLAIKRPPGQLPGQFNGTFPGIGHFVFLQLCLRLSTQDGAKVSSLNRGADSPSNNEGRVFVLLS